MTAPPTVRPADAWAVEHHRGGLAAGLFLVTFATLVLEVLDSRLLSVLTWYHLSFFAVSLAMLGMSAGAVRVFLGGERYEGAASREALGRVSLIFAISVPVSHVANLFIPIPSDSGSVVRDFGMLALATAVLAVPFYLSGIVVTIALTRVGARIGRMYAWDLLGASAGCLAVVPLLNTTSITSAALAAGAAGAIGAYAFQSVVGRATRVPIWVAALAIVLAVVNATTGHGLMPLYSKDRPLMFSGDWIDRSAWNSHSFVLIQRPEIEPVFLWGPGAQATDEKVTLAWVLIDGEAGTPITRWNGDPRTLGWVSHDVTAIPHHLRRGRAAVIGVGGGRDILSALWAGDEVTGIEVNGILLDALRRGYRDFARIADVPGVTLVHDEARAYLTRSPERYDVLQMSLIDTWAATGAGAFSLSENGLYTVEAWRLFLSRLTDHGVLSVSRWFNPSNVSETNRLLGLGVAALLDRGVESPRDHIIMAARESVATLVVSPSPFGAEDRARFERLANAEKFTVLVSPWDQPASPRLGRIADSRSLVQLDASTADPDFDYRPPTDARPFFFNMLKPTHYQKAFGAPAGGVIWGNIRATGTLVLLFFVALAGVAVVILWPLARAGRLPMNSRAFAAALVYFAAIGLGFMLIQVALLQRFSVLLGHPTYTFAIILFSMILFAGIGSMLSDRISLERRAFLAIPFAIALLLLVEVLLLGPAFRVGAPLELPGRTMIVLAFMAPLSMLLGLCFPIGMRLVGRHSDEATAWMWGINGACGVLASILAVAISMWIAIDANLIVAAGCYLLLVLPMRALRS